MPPQMHLMQMLIHSASTHTLLNWADPADRQIEGLRDFGYWQDMASTLERGCFDAVFFADSPSTYGVYKDSTGPSVQFGASWPNHDPMPLDAVTAAATTRLGFGVTLSTSGTMPYLRHPPHFHPRLSDARAYRLEHRHRLQQGRARRQRRRQRAEPR
jgi:hypothetical protein